MWELQPLPLANTVILEDHYQAEIITGNRTGMNKSKTLAAKREGYENTPSENLSGMWSTDRDNNKPLTTIASGVVYEWCNTKLIISCWHKTCGKFYEKQKKIKSDGDCSVEELSPQTVKYEWVFSQQSINPAFLLDLYPLIDAATGLNRATSLGTFLWNGLT